MQRDDEIEVICDNDLHPIPMNTAIGIFEDIYFKLPVDKNDVCVETEYGDIMIKVLLRKLQFRDMKGVQDERWVILNPIIMIYFNLKNEDMEDGSEG